MSDVNNWHCCPFCTGIVPSAFEYNEQDDLWDLWYVPNNEDWLAVDRNQLPHVFTTARGVKKCGCEFSRYFAHSVWNPPTYSKLNLV